MDRLPRGGCVAFSFRSVRSLICALTIWVGLFIRVDDRSLCAETERGRVHRERGTLGGWASSNKHRAERVRRVRVRLENTWQDSQAIASRSSSAWVCQHATRLDLKCVHRAWLASQDSQVDHEHEKKCFTRGWHASPPHKWWSRRTYFAYVSHVFCISNTFVAVSGASDMIAWLRVFFWWFTCFSWNQQIKNKWNEPSHPTIIRPSNTENELAMELIHTHMIQLHDSVTPQPNINHPSFTPTPNGTRVHASRNSRSEMDNVNLT